MGPSSSSHLSHHLAVPCHPCLPCICGHLQVFMHVWMAERVQMGHCPYPEGQLHESTDLAPAQRRAWHIGRKYLLNTAEKKDVFEHLYVSTHAHVCVVV